MYILKKIPELFMIMLLAVLSSVNYTIFVFPNSFAPAGIDGICTMIQDISKVSMGYLSLLINIPLLIIAYIFLNRGFAVKSTVYVLSFSISVILLKHSDISAFCYHTETGTSIVLAPVAAGAIRGILYALTLKLNGSSGGTDIIAAIVKKTKPHLNLMDNIFSINLIIALCSYFVYGLKPEPVICSIIYSFITSSISNHIQASRNETVKFEIITSDSEELCAEISTRLHQPATIMDAQGAYSGTNKKIVICVIDKQKVPYLEDVIRTFPDTVVFKSIVNNSVCTKLLS